MSLIESLTSLVGGSRRRSRRHRGGSGCKSLSPAPVGGKRRSRRGGRRRSHRGGTGSKGPLSPAPFSSSPLDQVLGASGGRRSRRKHRKSRRKHRKSHKKGGLSSQLVPLGLLAGVLGLGARKRHRRRSRRRSHHRRR